MDAGEAFCENDPSHERSVTTCSSWILEKPMSVNRLAVPTAVLGVVFLASTLAPSAPKEDKGPPPWELARGKVNAAQKTCMALALEYLDGKATVEQVHQWSRRWMDAEREASSRKADQIESLKNHASRMQQLEQAAQERLQKRKGLSSDVSAAEYHRLEAELALSRAKSGR
jgi:hypothetical protein